MATFSSGLVRKYAARALLNAVSRRDSTLLAYCIGEAEKYQVSETLIMDATTLLHSLPRLKEVRFGIPDAVREFDVVEFDDIAYMQSLPERDDSYEDSDDDGTF